MSQNKSTFLFIALERFFEGLKYGTFFSADLPPSGMKQPDETSLESDIVAVLDEPIRERQLTQHFFRPVLSFLEARTPMVWISKRAYLNMCAYVDIAAQEVGWMGSVSRTPGGDFFIEETFLLDQQVHDTETVLSAEAIGNLTMALLDEGPGGLEKVNKLRFWGHSHVRMGTGPSHTDEQTMMRFALEGMPWYVRGIFNKYGRAQFTLYFFENGSYIKDAPWAILNDDGRPLLVRLPEVDQELRAQIETEFKQKVKSRFRSLPVAPL